MASQVINSTQAVLKAIKKRKLVTQNEVINLVQKAGFNYSPSRIRTVVSELSDKGFLQPTGRVEAPSGRLVTQYKVQA